MAPGDEGTIDDRNYVPFFRTQTSSTAATLRISTVMAAVPMVQEGEGDEFRPEPEVEEVEEARLRDGVGPKTIRCGRVMPESYQAGAESRY